MVHLGIPLSIWEKGALLILVLKAFDVQDYSGWILFCAVAFVVIFYIGHLDLKMGIAEDETSLSNRYNPEIQKLLKRKRSRR